MCDAREKPLNKECHSDQLSYVAAGTDAGDEKDHVAPYAEDAVFKSLTGPVHANALNHLNSFWVQK